MNRGMKTKKQTIQQKIVATTVVLFMLFMMFGSLNLPGTSAAGTTTNLIQNIVAGGAGLGHSAMMNLVFTDFTVGVGSNSTTNMVQTNVWDYRGTGAGWQITGYANNLSTAATGNNNFTNSNITWYPAGGAIIAVSGSTTGITLGVASNLDGSRNMIGASVGNGMGNYRVNNVVINVFYNGGMDRRVGSYQAILTMTSS
jgi:hypothetical protein